MGLHGVSNIGDLTGQVWPYIDGLVYNIEDDTFSPSNDEINPDAISQGRFVSRLRVNDFNFSVMLNALNEQGDTRVLSNPKLTVMNGQPAMISVGRSVTYIKSVNVDVDTETNTRTYTADVDSVVEGVSLGVVASIVNRDKVILNLTPITTDLVGGRINYETFGDNQRVGVPEVQLREMNTIVEVRDGEMLIIGGLIDKIDTKVGNFLPILGSIPTIQS